MVWSGYGGEIERAEMGMKGKKSSKRKKKKKESMAIAILDSNIPAENMPVLLRKQQI
jgi:hypothetical protein